MQKEKQKNKKNNGSIKKIGLNKKNLLTLINEPKDYIYNDKINSYMNNKINVYNNNKILLNNNNICKTTLTSNNYNASLIKETKKKKNYSTYYNFEDNYNDKEEISEEYLEPFDLSSIFFKNTEIIKEKIIKEAEHKKWKKRLKKREILLSKNNEEIDFNINSNSNVTIIKALKKKGNLQLCKSIIKNILFKIK